LKGGRETRKERLNVKKGKSTKRKGNRKENFGGTQVGSKRKL